MSNFKSLKNTLMSSRIEIGRWARQDSIPVDNRKCQVCNIIEDEYHFVLKCSMFTALRKKVYFSRYDSYRSSMHKFIQLIRSSN